MLSQRRDGKAPVVVALDEFFQGHGVALHVGSRVVRPRAVDFVRAFPDTDKSVGNSGGLAGRPRGVRWRFLTT